MRRRRGGRKLELLLRNFRPRRSLRRSALLARLRPCFFPARFPQPGAALAPRRFRLQRKKRSLGIAHKTQVRGCRFRGRPWFSLRYRSKRRRSRLARKENFGSSVRLEPASAPLAAMLVPAILRAAVGAGDQSVLVRFARAQRRTGSSIAAGPAPQLPGLAMRFLSMLPFAVEAPSR